MTAVSDAAGRSRKCGPHGGQWLWQREAAYPVSQRNESSGSQGHMGAERQRFLPGLAVLELKPDEQRRPRTGERARGGREQVSDRSHVLTGGGWVWNLREEKRRAELPWKGRLGAGTTAVNEQRRPGRPCTVTREGGKGGAGLRAGAPKDTRGVAKGPARCIQQRDPEKLFQLNLRPDLSSLGSANCHIREHPEHSVTS